MLSDDELRRRLAAAVDLDGPTVEHGPALRALEDFDTEHPEVPGAVPRQVPK